MYFGGGEKGVEIPGSKCLQVNLETMHRNFISFKRSVESVFCPGILPRMRFFDLRSVVITMPDGTVMTVRDSHRGLSVTFKERGSA